MGRVQAELQCASTNCGATNHLTYNLAYTFDLSSSVTSATNGLGTLAWQPTYDSAGRMQSVGVTPAWTDPQFPSQLFNATTYGPAGITGWTIGAPPPGTSTPALTFTRSYDSSTMRVTGESVTGNQ